MTATEPKSVPANRQFCPACAAPTKYAIPDGDERMRLMCTSETCGAIQYSNPKITVATVAVSFDRKRVLLAKRKISPAEGLWNIPGGFLEHKESPEEGAKREAMEETQASVEILDLLGVYTIAAAGQVQLVYLSVLLDEARIMPGPESEEVGMYTWADIPWGDMAFTTHKWALLYVLNHFMNDPDNKTPIVPERRTKPIDYVEPGTLNFK